MTEPRLDERIARGDYAKKQILSSDRMVAWSHSSRFRRRAIWSPYAGKRLLDHGCGDGTFLALVSDLFPDAVGTDIDQHHVDDDVARLGDLAQLSLRDRRARSMSGKFDGTFDVDHLHGGDGALLAGEGRIARQPLA